MVGKAAEGSEVQGPYWGVGEAAGWRSFWSFKERFPTTHKQKRKSPIKNTLRVPWNGSLFTDSFTFFRRR